MSKQQKQLLVPALITALVLLFAACAKTVAAGDWQEQYDLGVRYLSEGNYQEAILAFTAAIEIDPKRPDAYLALADTYIAVEDLPAALATLQEGYDTTGDAALGERLEDLTNQAGQARSGDGPTEALPQQLTVLVQQEKREPDGWGTSGDEYHWGRHSRHTVAVLEYNELGFLIRSSQRWQKAQGDNEYEVFTILYEYTPDYGSRRQLVVDVEESRDWSEWRAINPAQTRGRGTSLGGQIYCTTDPGPDRPVRIDLAPEQLEWLWSAENRLMEGAYALCDYDEAGNAVKITTYDGTGTLVGTCTNTWATLRLGPDGTYSLEEGAAQ